MGWWSRLWSRIKKFLGGIWQECRDVKTLLLLFLVMAIVYSPVWVGYLLYSVTHWAWCLAVATAVAAFWLGPFTPFFPLCIAITLGIKRLWHHHEEHVESMEKGEAPLGDAGDESIVSGTETKKPVSAKNRKARHFQVRKTRRRLSYAGKIQKRVRREIRSGE